MDIQKTAEFLTELLAEAGKIMLSAHENAVNTVKTKSGTANFVTAYDVAVQDFLIQSIKSHIPTAVFMAEEKENDPAVLESDCCFIIDPIDGTANFIHDYRHSCISLAMLQGGKTVFGAVYDPYLDEMFCAIAGQGATLNGKPVRVSTHAADLAIVTFGTSPYYKNELTDKTFALTRKLFLAMGDIRRSGSAALDLAYLAAGRTDAFFEWRLSPWDFAAGALLITEAGGIITTETGAPISLAAPTPIFAGTPATHPVLLGLCDEI